MAFALAIAVLIHFLLAVPPDTIANTVASVIALAVGLALDIFFSAFFFAWSITLMLVPSAAIGDENTTLIETVTANTSYGVTMTGAWVEDHMVDKGGAWTDPETRKEDEDRKSEGGEEGQVKEVTASVGTGVALNEALGSTLRQGNEGMAGDLEAACIVPHDPKVSGACDQELVAVGVEGISAGNGENGGKAVVVGDELFMMDCDEDLEILSVSDLAELDFSDEDVMSYEMGEM